MLGMLVVIGVAIEMFLVVPGSSDVIIRNEYKLYNADHHRNITFSNDYFSQFYRCMCNTTKACTAAYDGEGLVYNITRDSRRPNSGGSGNSMYYSCVYERDFKLTCQESSSIGAGDYYDAFQVRDIQCQYSCIGLIWSYPDEIIDFSTSQLNVQCCDGNHSCPVYTIAPTTLPTAKITTEPTALLATKASSTLESTSAKFNNTDSDKSTSPKFNNNDSDESTSPKFNNNDSDESTFPKFNNNDAGESTSPKFSKNDSDDEPSLGLIIGVVIAVIFMAIIIAVIGFFVWRRKRGQNTSKPQNRPIHPTSLSDFNNARSTIENRYTNTQLNSPYDLTSPTSNYSNLNANNAGNAFVHTNALDGNFSGEARSLSAISVSGKKKAQEHSPENELRSNKLPCHLPSSAAKGKKEIEMSASEDGEYGYSTVHDQGMRTGDYETALVSQYEYATGIETQAKDHGYEYAGTENTFDTDTNKKAGLQNNENGSAYSVAGNINGSSTGSSTNQPQNIYSTLHEENRQIQNPYNALLQANKDAHDSHDATSSSIDQSKGIYSRLHEDKRQIQNPYNTLPHTIDDPAATDPTSSYAHNSKKASQNARYSFVQSTFNEGSNENANNNTDFNDVARSQNHTFHVLEGGKEDGDKSDKKRNIYFELEKQEGVSDSDTARH